MRIRTPYFLYIIGLLSLQQLVCMLNNGSEQASDYRNAIIAYLEEIDKEKLKTCYTEVADTAIYKQYRKKQAILDVSALAGIGYGINALLKRYALVLEQTVSDYQQTVSYGPEIAVFLSENSWIYSACAAGLTAGLACTYLNNYRKKARVLDEKTRKLIEPFEHERLRSLALKRTCGGLFHDSDVTCQEDKAVLDKCIDLSRNHVHRTIIDLHDLLSPQDSIEIEENKPYLKDRITALKEKIEIHMRPHTNTSETATTLVNAQRALAGTILLGALGGNGIEIKGNTTFNEIPAYIQPLQWPSLSVIYGLAYAAYTNLSQWNHSYMYRKIARLLHDKAEKSNTQSIDLLTDFGITAITQNQEKNREQGYLVELLGKKLYQEFNTLKKMRNKQQQNTLTLQEGKNILDAAEKIVDNLFPEHEKQKETLHDEND